MICLCILVHHFSIIAISEEQYIIYNISMKLKHIFLKNTSQNAPFEPIFHHRGLGLVVCKQASTRFMITIFLPSTY